MSEIKYVTFGQRARATVWKSWGRGSDWLADFGSITGRGKTQAAAMDDLSEQVRKVCDNAYDKGYLVQHEDGSQTFCTWFGVTVMRVRIREGRTTGSSMSDWESPKHAADEAVQESHWGPGAIVRL